MPVQNYGEIAMRWTALALAVGVAMAATPTQASFLETRAQWQRLSDADKLYYITGLADGIMTHYVGEPFSEARARGWRSCLQSNQLNNGDLVQMVESGYADVENWSKGPLSVFIIQMNRVCKSYENIERQRLNIPPIR